MAMLTAYFDESRMDEGRLYPVVAGYVGTVATWFGVTAKWKDVLRDAELPVFHAKDCWANKGPFRDRKKWRMSAKEQLVNKLLDIIRDQKVLFSVVTAIDNDAYLAVAGERKHVRHKYGSQYELCGYSSAILIGKFAEEASPFPVSFVFDQGNLYRHDFERAYQMIQRGPWPFAEFLGPLTFADDERGCGSSSGRFTCLDDGPNV